MKLNNLSNRNVSCMAPHSPSGGMPLRVMIPAGAILEVDDKEFAKCIPAVNELIKAGVLEVSKGKVTPVIVEEAAEAVEAEKAEAAEEPAKPVAKKGK